MRLIPKANRPVSRRRFGGIDLYAYGGEEEFELEIEAIRDAIRSIAKEDGPLAPSLIRYLVAQRREGEISQRVFSALLGAELRSGRLDGIVCESETGKPFRIIIEAGRKPEFETSLLACMEMIPLSGQLSISTIRDKFYPGENKGGWTRAYYLASRLARIGLVTFFDRFKIERAKDAYDAIGSIDDPFYSVDL